MSDSFANADGSIDIVSVSRFLKTVTTVDISATLSELEADPTDVLGVADLARACDSKEQAAKLYSWALDALQCEPSRTAVDTSLTESLALVPPEPGEFDQEVDGMARIAARMQMTVDSFAIAQIPPPLATLFKRRFSQTG